MRGKACGTVKYLYATGITPAYAGKSVLGDPHRHLSGDHPRLCGEKSGGTDNCTKMLGSPPPMRGKVSHISCSVPVYRITPAYAGKSV